MRWFLIVAATAALGLLAAVLAVSLDGHCPRRIELSGVLVAGCAHGK